MAIFESQGVKIFWDDGTVYQASTGTTVDSTGTDKLIGQIIDFNGPTGSAAKIDVSHLLSTAKEFIMGLRDEGDLSINVVYDPADVGHNALFDDRSARTQRGWIIKLTTTGNEKLHGLGFCTGFAVTGAVDDAVKAVFTIAIDGGVGYTTATSLTYGQSGS